MPTPHPLLLRRSLAGLFLFALPALALAQTPADQLRKPAAADLGGTPSQEVVALPEVVVKAAPPRSYTATEAVTATKTNTPLLEIPQAISVVKRQLIEDQNAQKLDDILKNVAGVTVGGYFGEWDYYRIRGFDVSNGGTYLDGLLNDGAPGEEPWGLERVEVVKGPASTLYGAGSLGGLVNLVSKHPKPENFANLQFTLGSFNLYEPALDAGWVLNSSKTIYLRLNALLSDADSFVDYVHRERIFVAPSITFELGDDTTLTLLSAYKADTDNLAFALPARGTVLPNLNGRIPTNRFIGNPDLGNSEYERSIRLGYELRHTFNDVFKLRQNFRYFWLYATSTDLSYPAFLDADDRTLMMSGYSNTTRYDGLRVDTALDATFDTGPVKHVLTGGVDYRVTNTRYDARDALNPVYIDLFSPRYGSMPRYQYGPAYLDKDRDSDLGFYLQEQAKFFKKVTLTLGGRYDLSKFDAVPGRSDDEAFTPKVGLTYEFVPGVALYGNYSRSYSPQWSSTDALGQPVAPEEGENWEAGVKFELLGSKLTGMLSVYQLTRENVATDNLSTPDPTDAIVTGEQRSRGFEFEMAAQFTPSIQFTAAYTYMDARITADNVLPVGVRLAGAPEHSVNAWLKYTIQEGRFKGLGFGIGGHYYSAQPGNMSYTTQFDLPARGIVDAAVYYQRGAFSAQVNVNNVLDREYFLGAYDDLYVLPGEPLNVRATIGWKF